MPKHLISTEYERATGLTVEYWSDPAQGTITIRKYQDVEPHVKACQDEFNSHSSKGRHNFAEGLGRRVASVSPGQFHQILKDTGINLMTATNDQVKRILNDSDYSKLRTAPGRL